MFQCIRSIAADHERIDEDKSCSKIDTYSLSRVEPQNGRIWEWKMRMAKVRITTSPELKTKNDIETCSVV